MYHISYIMYHVSCIMYHVSYLIYHISYMYVYIYVYVYVYIYIHVYYYLLGDGTCFNGTESAQAMADALLLAANDQKKVHATSQH